ncbi:MAG: isoprenyl transferase [Anaerohalosphaera sp.]|nr:isoprenyl transferase [Anaerohalosphaera sp.]
MSFEEKRIATALRFGIDANQIPRHIAIIMDGNGRWAEERGLPRFHGHSKGAQMVEEVALHCVSCGVECVTLYSFSLQNWKRPKEEIEFLMGLYALYLEGMRETLMNNNVRLVHLGQRQRLPEEVLNALDGTIEMTSKNSGMALCLALNYGSRAEIVDAVRVIAEKCKNGKLTEDQIDQQCISDHLNTSELCDPDLLVRTSGELRLSNFLLWQLSYAEFYVTDTYWPDFDKAALDKAILAFAERSRRFGDVTDNKPVC